MTDSPNLEELVQNVERDRRVDRRQKWLLFAVCGLLVIAVAVITVLAWQLSLDRDASKVEAATEQQAKQEYAQELRTVVCEKGDVEIYDADRCAELTSVAIEPLNVDAPRDGRDDKDGRDGKDGTNGTDGEDGADSTIAGADGSVGANGLDGAPGKDGLWVPGKDGLDGENGTDGVPGAAGADGANGRGILSATCEGVGASSYWLVTYDDGTTQTSDGPCRVQATVIPLPTEAP